MVLVFGRTDSGDQRRLTRSGSASEACSRRCAIQIFVYSYVYKLYTTVYSCIYTVLYTNTVYFTVGVQAIHCVVLTIAPVSHQLNTADDDDDDAE